MAATWWVIQLGEEAEENGKKKLFINTKKTVTRYN